MVYKNLHRLDVTYLVNQSQILVAVWDFNGDWRIDAAHCEQASFMKKHAKALLNSS